MSEDTNTIIVEENKPITKNPDRIAWGNKLAKMSKDLKEKKKTDNIEELN